jgi:thiol-disulfide isomerase/thioredoxin
MKRATRLLLAVAAAFALGSCAPAGPETAPEVRFTSLTGQPFSTSDLRGKVVLVNFWATWCAPCRKEMPHLNRIADKYRASGLVMLGVNIDDDVRTASDVAAKLGVKFPVLLDTDKKVSKLYDLNSMPSTLVIDRNGRVRYVHRGYQDGYEDQYDKQIRDLLKE